MFPADLIAEAERLLAALRAQGLKLATAESCTGGLITGLLTEIAGSSDVVERGFVTYSNQAKSDLLGVSEATISRHGAVSAETAAEMAAGALARSRADIAVAVTGIAGPASDDTKKPVGLVYVAVHRRGGPLADAECNFGGIGRREVRIASIRAALALVAEVAGRR